MAAADQRRALCPESGEDECGAGADVVGIDRGTREHGSAADDLQDELGPIESVDDGWVDDDSGPLFPGASEPTS